MTHRPIKLLVVEDSEDDAFLLIHQLKKGGFDPDYRRVETADEMRSALSAESWDMVISDHNLPTFNAFEALNILKELDPDLPLIVLSGDINQNIAVEAMRMGARDYIMKDDTVRLIPAIDRELQESSLLKEARQAEARNRRDLEAIMDHSPAVVYVKDTHGNYTFINKQFQQLFYDKCKEIVGKTDYDIFPKEIADELQDNDRAVLAAGHALKSEEVVSLQDDRLHTYVTIKFPLFDDTGEIYAICGISTDNTEHKQQEEQLRRTQKMDALGKLTGSIAHDYNNMLNIVLGYAEILENDLSDQPELFECAHEIRHAGKRGAKLTQKLLSFSRHKSVAADMLDINTLLRDEQHMLEKILTARIQLDLELAEDLWPVWVDGGEMEDCVINLCINAMHAIEGNGRLTLHTHNEQISPIDTRILNLNAGEYVVFSLTDTGCGMNESTRERIFEPFYSTKGEHGTGLGLSQVYGFVSSSGGAIKVYSEPHQGTQFVLYFPRYHEPDNEDESADKRPVNDLRGTETILVVDDEPALLDLTARVLGQQGYHVLRAEGGEQALEILKTASIDLLLSDVIMPGMDGYQLAAIVQTQYPTIKIQMASGFADNRNIGMVDESLQQNLLPKPYNAQVLLQRVRDIFDEK